MSETRRMHYVPETYLKKFSVQRGDEFQIHALPKASTNPTDIFPTNIGNICHQRDLYRLPGNTSEDRQRIEDFYKHFYEDDYDSVYQMLVDSRRETLSPHERYNVIGFVVSMYFRNVKWNDKFYGRVSDFIMEMSYRYTQNTNATSFVFEDEEISIAGKSIEQLQKEERKKSMPSIAVVQVQQIMQLIRIRSVNDVVTVTTLEDENEFITCDNPVTAKGEKGEFFHPMNPSNTLALAIDNKHIVHLRPWGHELNNDLGMLGRVPGRGILSHAACLAYNEYQLYQGNRFALGTKSGLEKHLAMRDAYIKRKQQTKEPPSL